MAAMLRAVVLLLLLLFIVAAAATTAAPSSGPAASEKEKTPADRVAEWTDWAKGHLSQAYQTSLAYGGEALKAASGLAAKWKLSLYFSAAKSYAGANFAALRSSLEQSFDRFPQTALHAQTLSVVSAWLIVIGVVSFMLVVVLPLLSLICRRLICWRLVPLLSSAIIFGALVLCHLLASIKQDPAVALAKSFNMNETTLLWTVVGVMGVPAVTQLLVVAVRPCLFSIVQLLVSVGAPLWLARQQPTLLGGGNANTALYFWLIAAFGAFTGLGFLAESLRSVDEHRLAAADSKRAAKKKKKH